MTRFVKDWLIFIAVLLVLAFIGFMMWFDNHVGTECVQAGHSWWFCRHFGFIWWVFS